MMLTFIFSVVNESLFCLFTKVCGELFLGWNNSIDSYVDTEQK